MSIHSGKVNARGQVISHSLWDPQHCCSSDVSDNDDSVGLIYCHFKGLGSTQVLPHGNTSRETALMKGKDIITHRTFLPNSQKLIIELPFWIENKPL